MRKLLARWYMDKRDALCYHQGVAKTSGQAVVIINMRLEYVDSEKGRDEVDDVAWMADPVANMAYDCWEGVAVFINDFGYFALVLGSFHRLTGYVGNLKVNTAGKLATCTLHFFL